MVKGKESQSTRYQNSRKFYAPNSGVYCCPSPYIKKKLKPLKKGCLAYVLDRGVEKGQSCEDRGNYEYDFLVFIHVGSAYSLLSQIAKDHFLR